MSLHAYSRVWVHLVWATIERRRLLDKPAAAKLSAYLHEYAAQKGIYMKINFVNPEHVHALVDLPTSLCIEDMMQFLKGGSSHWVNEQNLVPGKFGWGRGYGVFSVSQSGVPAVGAYIADQEKHHAKVGYEDELMTLVRKYGLEWRDDRENR
ncbi:MAG: IS200/IS605 family transposase [Verrucomicrobia bacterium]|nr:IS200/IS605 family transposase [Verrucomicrobiota bacterium]